MSLKDVFPRMHGATSIWISALILSLPWMNLSEFIASLLIILAVGSGHRIIYNRKPERIDYLLLAIATSAILYTAIQKMIVLIYSIPFILSILFRKDFRKYVLFSSVLTAIPSAYLPYTKYHLLFVSFALSYVLVADSIIYNDKRTSLLAFILYIPVSLYVNPIFAPFSILLAIPLALKFKTKTLGLYLLTTLILFSISEILAIYIHL